MMGVMLRFLLAIIALALHSWVCGMLRDVHLQCLDDHLEHWDARPDELRSPLSEVVSFDVCNINKNNLIAFIFPFLKRYVDSNKIFVQKQEVHH